MATENLQDYTMLLNKANKFDKIMKLQNTYTKKYIKSKRESKDEHFLELQRSYNKTYYDKNKDRLIQNQLKKYHDKKKAQQEALIQVIINE